MKTLGVRCLVLGFVALFCLVGVISCFGAARSARFQPENGPVHCCCLVSGSVCGSQNGEYAWKPATDCEKTSGVCCPFSNVCQ